MSAYSKTDKLLHRIYLGNYALAKAALEIEIGLYGKKAKQTAIIEQIYVTGLARSGTTGVMTQIFKTGLYASLQYSNMPFILNPNLWQKKSSIASHERAHNDGIVIDGNSPEEFDEYFWKSHLKDAYIKEDVLETHQISSDILEIYINYIQLICLAKGKQRYVCKNNNNVLRLDALRQLPNSRIIFLFRDPISHAASLLKLHLKFSEEQRQDPFSLEYFDYLGHHEFGLHHKPFALTPILKRAVKEFKPDNIDYWLLVWLNYYSFMLKQLKEGDILICFEDLMENPDRVYTSLSKCLTDHPEFQLSKGFRTTTKPVNNTSSELVDNCNQVYSDLLKIKI